MKFILLLSILLITNVHTSENLAAHVHGSVMLDIAVEKKQVLMMIKSPAASFLSFEYRAKTKAEKEALKELASSWRNSAFGILSKGLKGCKIKNSKWDQKFAGKNHSTFFGEALIECPFLVSGKTIEIPLKQKFKRIVKIKLQLLKENGKGVNQAIIKDKFQLEL